MPTAARCVVQANERVPLVRLVGMLDAAAAESVGATLLTRLVDGPDAVVVDLSGLTVAEPAALSILSARVQEAVEWAPNQIVLHGSPCGAAGTFPVDDEARSVDAALARLDAPAMPCVDLEPVVDAARRARQLVTDTCARWDLPEVESPACIAITEMVNNVVAHARTPMTVRLALGDGRTLHASVRDYCPDQPIFRGFVSPVVTGGRGLLLIDTMAERWGATALADGKIVWAVFDPTASRN